MRALSVPVAVFSFSVEERVHRRVDAAHEEAGHAGHLAEGLSLGGPRLETLDVRVGHLLVGFAAKSSVTLTLMPSVSRALIAGRPSGVAGTLIITFGRATAFHRRRASSSVPAGVVREVGRDLQAHVAVAGLVRS